MPRKLTVYEHSYLLKHGLGGASLALDGEMPVEYVGGKAYFLDYEFSVSGDVMIPRLETEEIVTKALDWCQKNYRTGVPPLRITDVGTGSGCIGISLFLELAKQNILSEIYLADISLKALEIARKNAQRLISKHLPGPKLSYSSGKIVVKSKKFSGKITFLQSDLLSSYPQLKYHLILANLPYIPTNRIRQLPVSVKNYEPHLALNGGKNGLRLVRRLISQAGGYLTRSGMILLEVDERHTLTDFSLTEGLEATIEKDFFGRNRYLLLKFKGTILPNQEHDS